MRKKDMPQNPGQEEMERFYNQPWNAKGMEQLEKQRLEHEKKNKIKLAGIVAGAVLAFVLVICFFTVHFWTEGSCTEDSVCKLCGKVNEAATGHSWITESCTKPQICDKCGVTGKAIGAHQWSDATCTEDAVCQRCGEPGAAATGHEWAGATCISPEVCTKCGAVGENLGDHSWTEATCTEDSVCAVCGEFGSAALGHEWSGGTCTVPAVCTRCSTAGETVNVHNWADATYETPKTCRECAAVEGRSLGYFLTWCESIEDTNTPGKTNDITRGRWADFFGNTYEESLRFWVGDFDNWADTEHIVYQLPGSYRELEVTVAAEESSSAGGSCMVQIYADDVLVYESPWVFNDTAPITASVDIGGCSRITVLCTTDSEVLCYCIVKAVLYN